MTQLPVRFCLLCRTRLLCPLAVAVVAAAAAASPAPAAAAAAVTAAAVAAALMYLLRVGDGLGVPGGSFVRSWGPRGLPVAPGGCPWGELAGLYFKPVATLPK